MCWHGETQDVQQDADQPDLHQVLDSYHKQLIAAYLHAHPYMYDFMPGLARRLHLQLDDLIPTIEELVATGILLKMGTGAHALIALNIRDGWVEHLTKFFTIHPHIPQCAAQCHVNLSDIT